MSTRQDKAFEILGQRSSWESKQRIWYQLRHDGLRRTNKPFPTAADLHFPLCDMHIGDLKPFWSSQVFGGDRLTDFVAMREQLANTTEACADYMDFELRYRTDMRLRMEKMFDTMLLRGRGVTLSTVDPFKGYKLNFKNLDPQFILMPTAADDFQDADFWVWVQRLSVDAYKRDRNMNPNAKLIERIRGQATGHDFSQQILEKELREGITHSHKQEEIILWNHVERTATGLLWHTYSPQDADQTAGIIRKPFYVPYKIGGEVSNPFTSFVMEVKDDGWYSPRGIAELNAAFEAFCTKCWNEESDFMTFANRPVYTSESPLDSTANLNIKPGSYVPGNMKQVTGSGPPIDFQQKINFARNLSVGRTKVPDMGQFNQEKSPGEPITAAQVKTEAGLQSVTSDHNGDVFRMTRMVPFYRHVWALMLHANRCQKDSGQAPVLTYYVANNLKTLPEQAMHDEYLVLPAGGNANRAQRIKVANDLYMLLKGNPNAKQDELAKNLIAAYDSRLVDKIYLPSDLGQKNESYQEAVELLVMEKGHPVEVLPGQDHATRAMEDAHYMHSRHVTGQHSDPLGAINVVTKHLQQHLDYLKQTNPQAFQQVTQQIAQLSAPTPPGQNAAPLAANGNGAPPAANGVPAGTGEQQGTPSSENIAIKLTDLTPSERSQALAKIGIQGASVEELIQTETFKAQIKNAGKPKPEPAQEAFGK